MNVLHSARIRSVREGGDPSEVVRAALASLRAGHVIAIPTDTVYGLAAAIDQPAAIRALYTVKQRPHQKAIPVLLSGASQAELVAEPLPASAKALADVFWPGGLTIIARARDDLPTPLTSRDAGGDRTVAIRVPDHALARAIIAASGGALAVTSANVAGRNPALTAGEITLTADGEPSLILDDGPVALGLPSTIVAFVEGALQMVRVGAIPENEIRDVISAVGSPLQPPDAANAV